MGRRAEVEEGEEVRSVGVRGVRRTMGWRREGAGFFEGANRGTAGNKTLEHSPLRQAQELSRRIWMVGKAGVSQKAEGMAQLPKASAS